jgi:CheY-like chemotaxis protein
MDSEVSKWHVLIVDDDMDSLGVAQQFLTFVGAKVSTATSGASALAAAEGQLPTVVLLDVNAGDGRLGAIPKATI